MQILEFPWQLVEDTVFNRCDATLMGSTRMFPVCYRNHEKACLSTVPVGHQPVTLKHFLGGGLCSGIVLKTTDT